MVKNQGLRQVILPFLTAVFIVSFAIGFIGKPSFEFSPLKCSLASLTRHKSNLLVHYLQRTTHISNDNHFRCVFFVFSQTKKILQNPQGAQRPCRFLGVPAVPQPPEPRKMRLRWGNKIEEIVTIGKRVRKYAEIREVIPINIFLQSIL